MIRLLKQAMRFWHIEILGGLDKPFSWKRLYLKCRRSNRSSYLLWFRMAYVFNTSKSKFWRRRAKLLNEKSAARITSRSCWVPKSVKGCGSLT